MVESGLNWGRSLKSVQLSRSIHLWCLIVGRDRSIRVSSVAVGHASAVTWDWLLVKSKRVEVCAGDCRWLGAEVEYPDNLMIRQLLRVF